MTDALAKNKGLQTVVELAPIPKQCLCDIAELVKYDDQAAMREADRPTLTQTIVEPPTCGGILFDLRPFGPFGFPGSLHLSLVLSVVDLGTMVLIKRS